MRAYETIAVGRDGDVAVVMLDRPESLNAAPPAMFDELRLAMADARDEGARALLIEGRGRGFCAGADIAGPASAAARGESPGADVREALERHYNPALRDLIELELPTIAAVRGPVAGIGSGLALTCDFVVASDTAYFLAAFVNIGLVPDGGASWLLPRLIGMARAAEMTMLGERVEADKAAAWGLIHRVVPDDALEVEARALAQRLAAGPTHALGAIRRLRWDGLDRGHSASLTAEAEAQERAADTADAREGAAAFMEKREAVFRGE